MARRRHTKLWLLLVGLAATTLVSAQSEQAAPQPINFARDIRPIFNKNCVMCHGGIKQAGGLSFIIRERVTTPAKSGEIAVKPGDPDHSELILRVTTKNENDRMPPTERGPALSEREISLLKQWIKEGAKWEEHWAYVAPKPQALPTVSDEAWSRQSLDRFVLARLDQEKLKPARPADRVQWLRRASFDLTGLPPSESVVKAFVSDTDPNAFEKAVDALLASTAFGERWASVWMDLARYADTSGFERDATRTVWPYRDWLIRSLNADMPYDQMVIRQLAGDMLPDATIADRVATTFHRNTQTNAEGGTDDEEFRVAAVLDRVNTTWEAVQGVTFRCVQCHSHPYDPIEESDFYRFYSLFNTTRDWDLKSEQPTLRVPLDPANNAKAEDLDRQISAVMAQERAQISASASAEKDFHPLKPSQAVSTRSTKLLLQPEGEFVDIVTTGTVSHGSRFTVDIPIPDSVKKLTALRVDGLPKNLQTGRLTPELGFVISQLRASIISSNTAPVVEVAEAPATQPEATAAEADQPETEVRRPPAGNQFTLEGKEIQFSFVFGDEADPFQDPQSSLNADAGGWGALPRIDRQRHAVFVANEPVDLPAGSVLRIVMTFNNAAGDDLPHVMNRGRFSISQSGSWIDLARDQNFIARRQQIASLQRERTAIAAVVVPVMKEQDPGQRRVTAGFVRGNWLEKGEVVSPGVPKLLGQLPTDAPADRLAMVRWMVSPQNPLAARVAVNRFWEQLFGTGLVETQEDFGSSGTPPSHPELLDYLALRFSNELGWSTKKLLRELVLSATYRQDSLIRPDVQQRDPNNRLLARGPRTRLTAEMVRDQALVVSGLLSSKMYGPPVMPPQPDGIWRSVYNNSRWQASQGEDKHRRAVYTFWKRTAGYPSFAMFDTPSREICTARRIPTNTPLQALVTLNDPVYMECAQSLASRMGADGLTEPDKQQIARGWQLAVGREPSAADVKILAGLYERSLARFQNDADASQKLAPTPQQAAMAVVANAILNLDVVMSK